MILKFKYNNEEIKSLSFTNKINIISSDSSLGKSFLTSLFQNSYEILLNDKVLTEEEYIIYSYQASADYYKIKNKKLNCSRDKYNSGEFSDADYKTFNILESSELKVIVFDDFDAKEILTDIFSRIIEQDIIVIFYNRKYTIPNYPIMKFIRQNQNKFVLEEYLTKEEIYSYNNISAINNCFVVTTEDKHRDLRDNTNNDFNYWKNNIHIIEKFYGVKIQNIKGKDGIKKLLKDMELSKIKNSLLCIDLAWDNLDVLSTIQDLLYNLNDTNVIISTYSYEQLVILSNNEVLRELDNDNSITELYSCIINHKSFYQWINKYYPKLLADKDINLFTTQEHLCKLIIQQLQKELMSRNKTLDYKKLDTNYLYRPKSNAELTNYF